MSEQTQTLIKDSSLPYKEKLVAGGYEELSHLPPSRDDSDWGLLLNSVLSPPELIKLKNALFPNVEASATQPAPAHTAVASTAAPSGGGTDSELKSMIEDSHRMLTALFSIQGESVLLDALSTDSEREAHHLDFETNVSVSYGCINLVTHPNMLRCVVTDQWHPQKMVCKGAHLLAIKEKQAMPLIGLKKCDIWDPRNGLSVLRTIDKRFESKELVYMPISGAPDAYRIEVLYDDLLPTTLGITVGELNGSTDITPATFNDINGRQLTFTTPVRPYRRVLLLIAFSAFTLALDNTKRTHTLATAAAPRDVAAWRALFDAATGAGSPPLPADGFIMQRFLKV